jgi:hypothetical protein
MQYQVLVQHQPDQSFLAAVLGVPDCSGEGQTEEEAIAKAKAALEARLAQGKVVTIEVDLRNGHVDNPLLKHFGRLKDDPTFDDFMEKIAEYRREVDETEAAK